MARPFALAVRSPILGLLHPDARLWLARQPYGIFCLVLRLTYPALALGCCTPAPIAGSGLFPSSPGKPREAGHWVSCSITRAQPVSQNFPSGIQCVCPLWEFCPLLPASQTSCFLWWVMGWALFFLFLEFSSIWGSSFQDSIAAPSSLGL